MSSESGLGEQALNKMAEMALASQMEAAESLQVQVKIDPTHLAKGEVDSLTISGEGLVMQPDLRMSELNMQINTIAVKPFKALFGQIEMVKPTDGKARIVLTEADLNLALNSEEVLNHLRQAVILDGLVKIESIKIVCHLHDGKVSLEVQIVIDRVASSWQITSTPMINDSQGVVLEDIEYFQPERVSPKLNEVLIQQTSEILNLRHFEMEGISLSTQQLQVEAGKAILEAKASVTQFPTS